LVLPFWYWLAWIVPEKWPLSACVVSWNNHRTDKQPTEKNKKQRKNCQTTNVDHTDQYAERDSFTKISIIMFIVLAQSHKGQHAVFNARPTVPQQQMQFRPFH